MSWNKQVFVGKVSVQQDERLEKHEKHAKLLLINTWAATVYPMKSVVFYLIAAHEIINTFNVLLFYSCLEVIIIANMMHAELWE